ncbi:MAG: ribosome silencing factor [Clostridia bacterium]|nr:ribosome silencing factor [Clostridia bacterium]
MENITKLPIEEGLTSKDLQNPEKLAEFIVAVLDSKKARDLKLLHVESRTVIADYFVLCSGGSRTQVNALIDEVEFRLEPYGITPKHIEGADSGIWVLEDFGSVILHVFTPDAREFYNLEKLYQETTEKDISSLISED